jgi:hypothetical protein
MRGGRGCELTVGEGNARTGSLTHPQSRTGRSNFGILVTCNKHRGSMISAVPDGSTESNARVGALRRLGREEGELFAESPFCSFENRLRPLIDEPSPDDAASDDDVTPMREKHTQNNNSNLGGMWACVKYVITIPNQIAMLNRCASSYMDRQHC